MNIPPVGGGFFFHADRRTDRQTDGRADVTKLIVAFHSFAKASKKWNPSHKLAPHAELPYPPVILIAWTAPKLYQHDCDVIMVGFFCCCSQDIFALLVHLVYRVNDHIAGLARFLLRTALSVCPRQGPAVGK
jgi:hypothetical protein